MLRGGGKGVRLAINRSWVQLPAIPLSFNDPVQVVHTHVPPSTSSIIWYRPKAGDAVWLER